MNLASLFIFLLNFFPFDIFNTGNWVIPQWEWGKYKEGYSKAFPKVGWLWEQNQEESMH